VDNVLGSARTGLIFTGLQEGAQLGGLTPPGQTEPGILYHVLSCWVLVGGELGAGTHLQLGSRSSPRERLCGSCGLCSAFSPHLYRCCCCSLCLLFCLTALILTHQFLPVSFHSPLHPGGGRGGRVALLLPAAAQTRTVGYLKAQPLITVENNPPESSRLYAADPDTYMAE